MCIGDACMFVSELSDVSMVLLLLYHSLLFRFLLLEQPKLRSTALKALQKALQLWPSEVRSLIEGADEDFRGDAVRTYVCMYVCNSILIL